MFTFMPPFNLYDRGLIIDSRVGNALRYPPEYSIVLYKELDLRAPQRLNNGYYARFSK